MSSITEVQRAYKVIQGESREMGILDISLLPGANGIHVYCVYSLDLSKVLQEPYKVKIRDAYDKYDLEITCGDFYCIGNPEDYMTKRQVEESENRYYHD